MYPGRQRARREQFGELVQEQDLVRDEGELLVAATALQLTAEAPAALPFATAESRDMELAREVRLEAAEGSGRVPASPAIESLASRPRWDRGLRISHLLGPGAEIALWREVGPEVEDSPRVLGYGTAEFRPRGALQTCVRIGEATLQRHAWSHTPVGASETRIRLI